MLFSLWRVPHVHFRHANKISIILIPLLALLHLHSGISLHHYHRTNSYYDNQDPVHQLCTDHSTRAKQIPTFKLPAPSFNQALPTPVSHVVAPSRIAVRYGYLASYTASLCRSVAPFSMRAPPLLIVPASHTSST